MEEGVSVIKLFNYSAFEESQFLINLHLLCCKCGLSVSLRMLHKVNCPRYLWLLFTVWIKRRRYRIIRINLLLSGSSSASLFSYFGYCFISHHFLSNLLLSSPSEPPFSPLPPPPQPHPTSAEHLFIFWDALESRAQSSCEIGI